jgi:hypothetical protein
MHAGNVAASSEKHMRHWLVGTDVVAALITAAARAHAFAQATFQCS